VIVMEVMPVVVVLMVLMVMVKEPRGDVIHQD